MLDVAQRGEASRYPHLSGAPPFGARNVATEIPSVDPAERHSAAVPPQPAAPGLAGHRLDGHRPTLPQLSVDTVDVLDDDPSRSAICTVGQRDVLLGLQIVTTVELTPEGVLRLQHALVNVGDSPYILDALLPCLPLPGPAAELLDLTGRWCRERAPQRRLLQQGAWVRDSRHGRTGHDSSLLLAAGTPGFGFGHGEVWAVHTAWSGDHTTWAERLPNR